MATNNVFINYTTRNNVYICDIYDNIPQIEENLVCYTKYNIQFDRTMIPTYDVYNSTYLLKTNKKLATIYLDKKYSYLIKDIINKKDEKIFYKFYKPIYKNINEEKLIELEKKITNVRVDNGAPP